MEKMGFVTRQKVATAGGGLRLSKPAQKRDEMETRTAIFKSIWATGLVGLCAYAS